MFCTKCGQPAASDAAFCAKCGNPLTNSAQAAEIPTVMSEPPREEWQAQQPAYIPPQNVPPQGYFMPQALQTQAPAMPSVKKKRTGLIIGLCAGGTVLLAIIAVLLFVWPGLLKTAAPVAGTWYSENRGEAIRFGTGSSFDAYTYYGEFEGDYQYDKTKGEGRIEMSDQREFDFVVDNDRLNVDGMGTFDRAAAGFNIDDFIDEAKKEIGADGSSD